MSPCEWEVTRANLIDPFFPQHLVKITNHALVQDIKMRNIDLSLISFKMEIQRY